MANRKIGAVIALDGEQQFKSAVTACTRELNTMKSALKLVEAQTDGQAKSLETLSKKHDTLNDVLSATKKRQDDVQKGFDHAQSDYERVGKQVEVYQRTLEKATKRLDEMKTSGNATDEELKEQEELVKKLSTVVDQGATAYDKAGARVEDWKKKLNDAKTETVKAEKAVDDIEDEMRELETATDKAADQLDDYGDEAKDAAKQTDDLDISLKSMIKNSAVNVAVDAMRAIGDKAIEAAKYVVDVGSTFEASMSKVEAISGATGGDLAKLTEKAKEMGSTTKFSASESAQAFEYMAMAGWKTNDMLEGIDGVMALAAASGTDLATTSDIVTDALTAFGEKAGEAGTLADIMAAASANANTNVGMMGETFKYAAPVAGALGISMRDTAIAIGLMANSGIKASQAGTSLRTGLTNLAKPTTQMQDAMDKYNVALVKNDDGSVNLRNTMIQLREKIGGLTESEQAAATVAIFGKDSMAGWLAVINASDEDFNTLTSAIDNSQGAAKDMADTMQNNLSGAMTIFKSALEGLGIELYDKAVKPLTGAVEFATGVINGLTNLLKDSRSENELVIDQIKEANKELVASVDNASTIQAGAEATAGKIGVLVEALISLNKQENLDETQKKRLKAIYDDLVELVPAMAGHYNEETGKIDLTTEAVRKLTQARKDEIIEQGRLTALSDIYEKMGAAQAELQKAMADLSGMQKQHDMWVSLRDRIGEAQSELNSTFHDMNKGPDLSALEGLKDELIAIAQEALNSGAITMDTYDKIAGMFDDNWSESELAAAYETLQRNVEETDIDIKNAEESMGDLQREYDNAEQTVKNLEESINSNTKATREEIGAVDDSSNSIGAMTDEKLALKKATDEGTTSTKESKKAVDEETESVKTSGSSWAEYRKARLDAMRATDEDTASTKNNTEAIDEAIKAVHAQADAEKALRDATQQARDDMTKAFDDIQKSVESAFNLNPFDQWQQDLQKGWEAFDGAMLSQIEGMKNYQTNMDLVREYLAGKAPDFVQFLEDMGQSGAQFVDDLARGIREGGDASMSSIDYTVGLWRENHSLEDAIEDSFARSKLSAELGLEGLSEESIRGWEDLGYAFDEGNKVIEAKGEKMSQTTRDSFWQAVDAAKAVGAEVPKGLADSIRNSEDPQQAIADATVILDESLRARGEVLLLAANDLGIVVPSGIAEAIRGGAKGADLQNAVGQLADTIKTKAPDFEAAGTEAGEAAGNATAAGISNKEEDVTVAADDVVEAAKGSASTASELFDIVGHTAMEALKGGIREKSQDVSGALRAALTIAKNNGTSYGNEIFPGIGSDIDAHIVSGINEKASAVTGALNSIMDAMNTDASTQCNSLRTKFYNAINDIATAVSQTQLRLPSIQLPHIWWDWNQRIYYGDGGWTDIPTFHIDWYAKAMKEGMILDNPTIFGMMNGKLLGAGEAGSETVVGTSSLMDMIGDAVNDGLTSFGRTADGTNSRLDALLDAVEAYLPQILDAAEADKEAVISDRTMNVITQQTSEAIGRNVRRMR